jgi:hypothetical protein
MDDSPADADSLTEVIPPYPFRPPDGGERPWPDPMAIRLVPVPDCNPPFDDELPGGRVLTSLVFPLADDADDPGPPPSHDDDESRGGDAPAEREERPGSDAPAEREVRPGQDELGRWPSQFAQVLTETLAGARPASQLTPWTTERARAHIRRLGPLLAVDRRPRVQRVRATQPAEDVVEVAVVAEFGSRTRALAARLERAEAQPATLGRPGRQARWLCTAIESA